MKKQDSQTEKITRKEAIKKVGTYAAFTALGTMVLLSPKASQAGSTTPEPPKKEKKGDALSTDII
jgi:sorbitol-specific phosphotransferase system component IIC